MTPTNPEFSLQGLKPSIIATNATATVEAEGRPLVAADYAAWRAHPRYGIHREWKYVVQAGTGDPLHPFFLQNLKERRDTREALAEELKRDVMDAVTTSDLIGGSLSILLTTSGTPVTADNIAVDVYVTPRELRHHKRVFEEAVSVLTQIFIQKMAIPHCHEMKRRGILHGFMKQGSVPRGLHVIPTRNAWPTPPIPYTEVSLMTYQSIPGCATSSIGQQVLPFLVSVFPEVGSVPPPQDEYDALADDDSLWPNKAWSPGASESPITQSGAITTAARATEAAAQDMCRAAARAYRDVRVLQSTLSMKATELEISRTRAMQLGLRADEALTDHLLYHGFEQQEIEQWVSDARVLRAALLSGTDSTLAPVIISSVSSPSSPTYLKTSAGAQKCALESPPSTPRISRAAKPMPATPTVPSAVLRGMTPSRPVAPSARIPRSSEVQVGTQELSAERSNDLPENGHVHAILMELNMGDSVADALYGIMQCHAINEWPEILESRFEAEVMDSVVTAMRKDWRAVTTDALDVALSPYSGRKGKGKAK